MSREGYGRPTPAYLFRASHHRFSSCGQSKISRVSIFGVSCRPSETSCRLRVMGWSASDAISVARGRAAEAIFCVKSAPHTVSFLVLERGQLCWLLNCRRWRHPGRSTRPATLITRMTRDGCQSDRLAKKSVAINLMGGTKPGLSCLTEAGKGGSSAIHGLFKVQRICWRAMFEQSPDDFGTAAEVLLVVAVMLAIIVIGLVVLVLGH